MFASLSPYLPSALQLVSQGARAPNIPSPPPPTPPAPDADPPPRKDKKDKKDKYPNEAFIIVRPPPSVSNQPLSLQVQLVPPQSRNDKPLQALDTSPDDLNTDLMRTHSNGSESSYHSGYTTASSVSSFSSTSTSSSSRRMIIPLYNLHVHSVMPTTVLDAGTDAKVAKFAKRGLEVIDLAFLEPIEVRSTPVNTSLAAFTSTRVSLDETLRELCSTSNLSSSPPVPHGRPHTSYATTNKPTINLASAPPLLPLDQPPQRLTKKLFAKMFKKKDTPSPLSIAVPPPEAAFPHPSPFRTSVQFDETPALQLDTSLNDTRPSTSLSTTTASQSVVLGVHPTLYPPVSNPRGRPIKYVWVVRKWLKGVDAGILNGVMGKLNVGARDTAVSSISRVEVRFEWSREPRKRSRRKSRPVNTLNARNGHSPARPRPQTITLPRYTSNTLSPERRDHRSSMISHSSGSDTAGSSYSAHQLPGESEDSDPEDSETPWTCSVAVQRLGQSPQEPCIRIKVATLAPTPHHPKVVGLLKVPFPLPDIEVERLEIRRRVVTAQGISKTTVPNIGEFVLTAEEIKDTVSSTALWLVVREAFGGVGRERKKGKS